MSELDKETLLAELVALNTAVQTALIEVVKLSPRDPNEHLSQMLEDGLRDIPKGKYDDISPARLEVFLEKAAAAYSQILTGIRFPQK